MEEELKYIPGSTTICSILNIPALVKWANNLGLKGIDSDVYVENEARIGTLIHAILNSHVTKTEVDLSEYSEEEIRTAEESFFRYIEWEKDQEIETIFAEKTLISNDLRYKGVIDFYCKLNGKYTLVDFKTSKNIYDGHILQVSSYLTLLKENNLPVDQLLIINVGKKENKVFHTKFITLEETENYLKIFNHLLDIYWLKRQMKWR